MHRLSVLDRFVNEKEVLQEQLNIAKALKNYNIKLADGLYGGEVIYVNAHDFTSVPVIDRFLWEKLTGYWQPSWPK